MAGLSFKGMVCAITQTGSELGDSVAALLGGLGATPVLLGPNGNGEREWPEWIPLDLSSPASVADAADSFKSKFDRCACLFLCAEIRTTRREITDDNLERMFAINYPGQYLLTNLLLDELRRGSPSTVVVGWGFGPDGSGGASRRSTCRAWDRDAPVRPFNSNGLCWPGSCSCANCHAATATTGSPPAPCTRDH